jgi:glutathione peroxidase-family protein
LPRLESVWRKYKDRGFTIVAVERKRDTERATRLIADDKLTYSFLEDGEGDAEVVRKVFGVRWFPTSYLIDRDGRVVYAHTGFEKGDEAKLSAEIEKLLDS